MITFLTSEMMFEIFPAIICSVMTVETFATPTVACERQPSVSTSLTRENVFLLQLFFISID